MLADPSALTKSRVRTNSNHLCKVFIPSQELINYLASFLAGFRPFSLGCTSAFTVLSRLLTLKPETNRSLAIDRPHSLKIVTFEPQLIDHDDPSSDFLHVPVIANFLTIFNVEIHPQSCLARLSYRHVFGPPRQVLPRRNRTGLTGKSLLYFSPSQDQLVHIPSIQ